MMGELLHVFPGSGDPYTITLGLGGWDQKPEDSAVSGRGNLGKRPRGAALSRKPAEVRRPTPPPDPCSPQVLCPVPAGLTP